MESNACDVGPQSLPSVTGPFELSPFRGLLLAGSKVGGRATAEALSRPYRGVAARLLKWEDRGRVRHDAESALYLHEYTADGITVRGLVGAVGLDAATAAQSVVVPHEAVHPPQVEDLAQRMNDMSLNPAPILLVHRGPTTVRSFIRELITTPAWHTTTDRLKQHHRIWRITEPEHLTMLSRQLAGTQSLVADGHHRYAAYLKMAADDPGYPRDHGLAMLIDHEDTPLHAGAIHRVLHGVTISDLHQAARVISGFDLQVSSRTDSLAALSPRAIAVTDGDQWASLRVARGDRHDSQLAVQRLHHELLSTLTPRSVEYRHTVQQSLKNLPGAGAVALLMPAASLDDIMRTALAGIPLPEKATSFQPKPSVGVLMRSLDD